MKIVFAQGNPGQTYNHTRHNVGFFVLDKLANLSSLNWSEKAKFKALVAETLIAGEKVLLVKPTTFYNETGISARKLVDFYNIDIATDFLAVHDDLALPFGTIRTRRQGSDAGNNGIKSLNSHLEPDYHRIRIGVWNELRNQSNDADFVLSRFNKDETEQLEKTITPHVIDQIEKFCAAKLEITSHKI